MAFRSPRGRRFSFRTKAIGLAGLFLVGLAVPVLFPDMGLGLLILFFLFWWGFVFLLFSLGRS